VDGFSTVYERLNPEQKRAVDTIEGPIMVLAGPGTGKTQVLTARIARILETAQVGPTNILALTFTQSAAKNMQERLVRFIGPTGYGVRCTTFHSFCSEVIGEFPEYFPLVSRSSEALGKLDTLQLIESVFASLELPVLKKAKAPHKYVREALKSISDYKREGFTPQSLLKAIEQEQSALEQSGLTAAKLRTAQREIDKNTELASIFLRYEEEKTKAGRFDYDDMILWVRSALQENEEVLAHYQEAYQYVLVDEFQDTNTAQLDVVRALLSHWGESANIFVVGDPHQSIYRFQGASLSNTFGFLKQYPNAEVITLRTGYRCGQVIYDAAAKLLTYNGSEFPDERLLELALPLQQPSGELGTLSLYEAPDSLAECLWVADRIKELHDQGLGYKDMAVLYRKHSHITQLREVLDRLGIPTLKEGSRNIFEVEIVTQLVTLLRFLAYSQKGDEAGVAVPFLRLPWLQLDQAEIWKLLRLRTPGSYDRNPWQKILNNEFGELKPEIQEQLKELRSMVTEWIALDGTISVSQLLEKVLSQSSFYNYMKAKQRLHDLSAVVGFLRWVTQWSSDHRQEPLEAFLEYLDLIREHEIAISAPELQLENDAVRLATAHQAKGQEWEHVFVLHAMKGYWDNQKKRSLIPPLQNAVPHQDLSSKERNEDERRLFYVALTRAKKAVWLSWSATMPSGEALRELQRSQFVEEIAEYLQTSEVVSDEKTLKEVGEFLQPKQDWVSELSIDRAWLTSLLKDFSLSASALNNFLRCPVAFLFQDVLKMPLGESNALAIGTAVHAAMEFIARHRNIEGVMPETNQIIGVINRSLLSSRLPEHNIRVCREHSQKVVLDYLKDIGGELPPALMVEKSFGKQYPVMLGEIALVGKIDRIEELETGIVRVIDFKTSKPTSQNEIQGKTKNSDGRYWRQLLFYRVLADHDPDFRYKVREGQLVFLEPNDSGKYKSETFTFDDLEVANFEQEITRIYSEIQTLAFLELPPCGLDTCDVCKHLGFNAKK
jgi:DNA helicase-2/ATP-dependent DNA helicase PcrA